MGGEVGKSLGRTAARSATATAIEGLGAETRSVFRSARQLQSRFTPFPPDRQASGRAIQSPQAAGSRPTANRLRSTGLYPKGREGLR